MVLVLIINSFFSYSLSGRQILHSLQLKTNFIIGQRIDRKIAKKKFRSERLHTTMAKHPDVAVTIPYVDENRYHPHAMG